CTIAGRSSGGIADLDAERRELAPERGESRRLLVQDRREERGVDDAQRGGDVRGAPGAPRRDHRQRHGVVERGEQLEVVARARAVAVDRGDEQLPRAARLALARPVERRTLGLARRRVRAHATVLGVDRDDDRLRAERLGQLLDERGPFERGGVDADLGGAGGEHGARVVDGTDAAAEREGDRHALGDAGRDVDGGIARAHARLHVEEHELVGAGVGVRGAELDRVADVAQPREAHALDDAPVGDVETRDQTRERHRSRNRAPARPLFSGWNWTPTKAPCSAIAVTPSAVAVAAGVSAAYEWAYQYVSPPPSSAAQPMRGTPPSRRRTLRPGTSPSPRMPPSSSVSSRASCRPRQMPRIGRLAAARPRSASSRPRAASPAIAAPAEPTPGSTARSAVRTSCGSSTTRAVAPSRSSASCTERVLPAP